MMTREMVLEMLAGLGADVDVDECGSEVHVTVQDFEGFDDDWEEIDRELDDEDAVNKVYDRLKTEASEVEGYFYHYFRFDGFTVVWGYASMEI